MPVLTGEVFPKWQGEQSLAWNEESIGASPLAVFIARAFASDIETIGMAFRKTGKGIWILRNPGDQGAIALTEACNAPLHLPFGCG